MKKIGLFALAMGFILPLILAGVSLSAATPSPSDTASSTRTPSASTRPSTRPALPPPDAKTVQAARTTEPITLDGRLDEPIWKSAQPANGFTQNDPQDGSPATEQTNVWVAYDDHALYVAAFCRDSEPAKIRKRLGRRDSQTDSDWFAVAVDPYFDRRSGYVFVANPAGAITDAVLSNDVNEDDSWDGVWENKAAVNGEGWAIEIRIPFNQIRFPKKDEYVWGVNFMRMVRRKNEQSTFNWSPKSEMANVSRFARLEGLRGISPGGRIEFMPYAVSQAQFRPSVSGNPFETGHRYLGNAGFDLKVGLKSNLTLDATVNPDFGQVEVDPAVLNLSAYETYYE
ncbi:MAG: carbohydrate binding family 9 domain-containing protein, partial [Candidatus Aminicenantes bacterium]|nr:carbohydrate binding family 9 domain-containing protein [Candidatus Aminicenantes bacterium]